MRWVGWIWHELTRPRGRVRHRFYRVGRGSRSGVAMLLAIASILFLTVVVTEIVHTSAVRLKTATNHRDEAKAEALAITGLSIYRLFLVASKGLDNNPMLKPYMEQFGITGDFLWQSLPMINSELLRMAFVSGGDLDAEDAEEQIAAGGLSDEDRDESREDVGRKRNFLDFDGDFYAEVMPEDKRINIANLKGDTLPDLQTDPNAVQLYSLMTGVPMCDQIYGSASDVSAAERDEQSRFWLDRDLEPWELIARLKDWTDADGQLTYGGDEDGLYDRLDDPYRSKNQPFDTLEEVRLVEGWHRDDVWERFGNHLTVYGTGKINVSEAECEVLWALTKSYVQPTPSDEMILLMMREIEEQRMLTGVISPDGFEAVLAKYGTVDPQLKNSITDTSTVFRITAVGQVNNATATVEAVYDFSQSAEGKVLYWRVR